MRCEISPILLFFFFSGINFKPITLLPVRYLCMGQGLFGGQPGKPILPEHEVFNSDKKMGVYFPQINVDCVEIPPYAYIYKYRNSGHFSIPNQQSDHIVMPAFQLSLLPGTSHPYY